MFEFNCKLCEVCGAVATSPGVMPGIDPSPAVPEGYRIALHLCHHCVKRHKAKRSDWWGWFYRPEVDGEDGEDGE
jgi:hypothetical protein